MDIGNLIEDFTEWLATLPADFAFLLALPFAVAAAGLLRCAAERERPEQREAPKHVHGQHHHRWSRVH